MLFLANIIINVYFCNIMNNKITRNSLKAWILAARPKTLVGAGVPVMIGIALSIKDTKACEHILIIPTLLCFLFAFIMQIDANFVNDYFDNIHGNDDCTRLGPLRACSQGWISMRAMKIGIIVTTLLACIVGLPLIYFGSWSMIIVGMMCVLFCFLYTTKLSYLGYGDILVLIFFGVIPVTFTYFLTLPFDSKNISLEVIVAGIACGFVIDTLLVVNNYRDIDNDKKVGKRTLVVKIGQKSSLIFYLSLGILACFFGIIHLLYNRPFAFLFPFLYLIMHIFTYKKMIKINKGKELNVILANTSRNIFVYGVLTMAGLMI